MKVYEVKGGGGATRPRRVEKKTQLTFLNIRLVPGIAAKSLADLIWIFSSAP